MAVFGYQALNREQAVIAGVIVADSARQARDQLRLQGLTVRKIDVQRAAGAWWRSFIKTGGSSARLTGTVRELSTLLSVGVPLVESLDVIQQQHTGAFQTSLLVLRDRLAGGASLAEAMAEQPTLFDELTIRMAEVGENAGNLDVVLSQLADFHERAMELKDRVFSALLYPLIVLLASCVVSIFLMTVVVPMLLKNLIEANRPLPWPTRVLMFLSDGLVLHGFWVLLGTTLIAGSVSWWLASPTGKKWWHGLLLKLPVVGEMARKQAVGRGAMIIAVLMRSGIEFLQAISIAGRSMKNVVLQQALEQVARDVGRGVEIADSLRMTNLFSPVVVQVFAVGQQTGRLEEMLERLATDFDRQVNSLSGRLASVLEPILILLLSVFVGFILFATILPILEAGNVL